MKRNDTSGSGPDIMLLALVYFTLFCW